jgi:hypothetical protein
MITHIFEDEKLDAIKKGMETAEFGICMSSYTRNYLINQGIDDNKLFIILPAHDEITRKKIRVAIVTNVYPDGCKKEGMFYELLNFINKNNLLRCFVFSIMGKGWDKVELAISGIDRHYLEFNMKRYKELLEYSDYMLYLGNDEGACSILDAAQVGLKTIAPFVGFHREIGIDYSFTNQTELNEIFKKLCFNPVENLTWGNYTKQLTKIWSNSYLKNNLKIWQSI